MRQGDWHPRRGEDAPRPASRVMVTPERRRDGSVREYALRVWFPIEGWGVVRSRHETADSANAAAERLRGQLGEEPTAPVSEEA